MSVWLVQHDNGVTTDGPRVLERPDRFLTDADYLVAKVVSHTEQGWSILMNTPVRVQFSKPRFVDQQTITRELWIE